MLGLYGKKTERAVKVFQCKYKLLCNGSPETTGWGLVGTSTLEYMNALVKSKLASPTLVLTISSRGQEVLLLQHLLIKENLLFPSKDDVLGLFGSKTENAVKKFQCQQAIVCAEVGNQFIWGKVEQETKKKFNELYPGTF